MRPKRLSSVATMRACSTGAAQRQRKTLMPFIARRPVDCSPVNLDQYGRTVAVCSIGGDDVAEWLVCNGPALDLPTDSKRNYTHAQPEAAHSRPGIGATQALGAGAFP